VVARRTVPRTSRADNHGAQACPINPRPEGVINAARVTPRRGRGWPRAARIGGAMIATVALALPLSACGGGSRSSTVAGGSASARGSANSQLLAFSRCMRSNGLANFPDPQPGQTNAKYPDAQQLDVSSSRYQAAQGSCAHLLPNGGQSSPAATAQSLRQMLQFSQCMRARGVPSWPDPTTGADGNPSFNLVGVQGIPDPSSLRFQSALHECGHLVPHRLGGIPVSRP
jgi:hypothetical protein